MDRDPRTREKEREVQGEKRRTCAKKQIERADEIVCGHLDQESIQVEKHVGSCSVSNEEYSGSSRYPVTRPLMEETMRSTLSSSHGRGKARSTRGLRRF